MMNTQSHWGIGMKRCNKSVGRRADVKANGKKAIISCDLMCKVIDASVCLQELTGAENAYDEIGEEYKLIGVEVESWDLGEVVDLLFRRAQSFYSVLKVWTDADRVRTYLDICIVHDKRYPALILEGETMRQIRGIKADIAIDLY